MTKSEELFHELVAEIPDIREAKMFGALCAKTPNGKSAVMFWNECIVVKLGEERLKEALGLSGAQLFEPMAGRPMKEWVVVPYEYRANWKKFLIESVDAVRGLESKKSGGKKSRPK